MTTQDQDALEALVAERRRSLGKGDAVQPARWGLALSGGGVRSATFCYGLITALARSKVFRRFDLMSTVSGGGYIGAMVGRLAQSKPSATDLETTLAEPGSASKERGWLRANSRYLIPRGSRDWLFVIVTFLRNLAAIHVELGVLALTLGCLLGAVDVLVWWLFDSALLASTGSTSRALLAAWTFVSSWPTLWLFVTIPAVFAVAAALEYWYLPTAGRVAEADARRHQVTERLASSLRWFLALLLLGAIDWVAWRIANRPTQLLALGGSFAVMLTIVRTLLPLVQGGSPGGTSAAMLRLPAIIDIAGRLGLVVLAVFWTSVAHALFTRQLWDADSRQVDFTAAAFWIAAALLAATAWTFLSGRSIDFLNRSSLHHFYRSRLARTYLGAANAARAEGSKVTRPESDDDIVFSQYAPQASGGPVHLINVCVNQTYQRGGLFNIDRQGELMTLVGPSHCRVEGKAWQPIAASTETLGTWMAVSGAAAAPGLGAATRPGWAAMLTTLGVRLGYWWDSGDAAKPCSRVARLLPKYAYLLDELFAHLPGSNARVQYLSDGGHSENTAAYPLIAAGCRLIVLADCGADPEYRFDDLENLIRRVRIDLDVDLRFIEPDATMPAAIGTLNDVVSEDKEACLAVATILYPQGESGLLVVVKPNITSKLPEDLYNYWRDNPSFPQQSTADQLFGEDQWESYFSLGKHIGSFLTPELLDGLSSPAPAATTPALSPTTPASSPTKSEAKADRRRPTRLGVRTAASATLGMGAILTALGGLWTAFQHGTPPNDEVSSQTLRPLYESYAALRVDTAEQNEPAVARMAAQLMMVWQSAREAGQDVALGSNHEAVEMLRITAGLCQPLRDRLAACRTMLTTFTCPDYPREPSAVEANAGYWARHEPDATRKRTGNYCDDAAENPGAVLVGSASSSAIRPAPAAAAMPALVAVAPVSLPASVALSPVALPLPTPIPTPATAASAAAAVVPLRPPSTQVVPDVAPAPASNPAPVVLPPAVAQKEVSLCKGVTVYIQIYGSQGRDSVRTLRALWNAAGASVPTIEDVNESARRQGRNAPTPYARPTVIFHDDVAKRCADVLADKAFQPRELWDVQRLRSSFTPTPRTVEVWLPPSAVANGFEQWAVNTGWCYQEKTPPNQGAAPFAVHCHPTEATCNDARGTNTARSQSICAAVSLGTAGSQLTYRGWAGSHYGTGSSAFGAPFPQLPRNDAAR
ncbi:MAG: hypothetical protein ABI460_06940 [Caldimonas sp.]